MSNKIIWTTRRNGDFHEPVMHGTELDEQIGIEHTILIAEVPDWVLIPEKSPLHPGKKVRVTSVQLEWRVCPACHAECVMEVTRTVTELAMLSCKSCRQFVLVTGI